MLLLQLGMKSESSFIKDQALSISFEPNRAPKLNLDYDVFWGDPVCLPMAFPRAIVVTRNEANAFLTHCVSALESQ